MYHFRHSYFEKVKGRRKREGDRRAYLLDKSHWIVYVTQYAYKHHTQLGTTLKGGL